MVAPEKVPGRMTLLMILFLNLLTIYMNVISTSPKSTAVTNIMGWMIACMSFVLFAIIEYGIILFHRFVFRFKSLPEDYGKKQLMKVDITCLFTAIISFTLFTVKYFVLTF